MVNEVFILAVKVQNTYWSGKKPFPSPSPALTGVVSYDCRSHGTWYLHTANTALTLSSRQNYIIHQSTFSNWHRCLHLNWAVDVDWLTRVSLLLCYWDMVLLLLLSSKGLFCNSDRISSCLPNLICRIRQGYENNFWHFHIAIQYKSVRKPFFDIRIKYSLTAHIRPSCQFFSLFPPSPMAELSDDKENQHPSIPALEPTAIQDQPKKCGRPKGSKNKTKNSITPVSPNTTQVKQSKKTTFESQTAITPSQVKTPHPRTRYSDADNKILMGVFLDQKVECHDLAKQLFKFAFQDFFCKSLFIFLFFFFFFSLLIWTYYKKGV